MFVANARRFFAPENENLGSDPADDDAVDPADDDADPADDDAVDPADDDADPAADDAVDPADDDADHALTVQTSRKETRFQKLANEARDERDKRIRAEARAEALEQSRTAPPDNSAETARARAEKLALMDPTERELFETKETMSRLERGYQMTQIQIADYADKQSYEGKAASNPVYAKHKDWVENALAAERKAGRNPSRELLLRFKIGEEALSAKPSKKTEKAKADAAVRVKSSQGAPTSARSDVGGGKTNKGDSLSALESRLRNVQI